MLINNEVIECYLFELIERVTRFYIHLEDIKDQFYLNSDSVITDKLHFIESYEEVLNKIITISSKHQAAMLNDLSLNQKEEIFKNCLGLYKQLKILHEDWLFHLPRPSEPLELRRFCRVIKKQVLILEVEDQDQIESEISIYVSEKIGEETYAYDPLSEYKSETFNKEISIANNILNAINSTFLNIGLLEIANAKNTVSKKTIHITIPRVDAGNPCHWPILMHEVGHHVIDLLYPHSDSSVKDDFIKYLNEYESEYDKDLIENYSDEIQHWLLECWCDLFACISMGYSYWFAQYAVFLNVQEYSSIGNDYPPPLFRLALIRRILDHRFSSEIIKVWESEMDLCEQVIEFQLLYSGYDFWDDRDLTKLLSYFKQYFSRHFFNDVTNESLNINPKINDSLLKIIRYTTSIKSDTINDLVISLQQGLPIPSIRIPNLDYYKERTVNIQEILFAAWIARNGSFRSELLNTLAALVDCPDDNLRLQIKENIEKKVRRFDQSILRSIQVSEWFDLFDINEDKEHLLLSPIEPEFNYGTLVDHEILSHIDKGNIKVIPIFNLSSQLGTTSLDIRLGTSFQLFSPNEFGVIDFVDKKGLQNLNKISRRKDLDYLESIVLMPGQFVLGHSMEYIKLSSSISADLEGRSSFARLGIEIHMTAGFVDPGFEGVLTFEIYNAGHSPVRLFPGLRLGQLRFMNIREPLKSYSQRHKAKYKGLLEHHNSLQGKDYEIDLLEKEIFKTHEKL